MKPYDFHLVDLSQNSEYACGHLVASSNDYCRSRSHCRYELLKLNGSMEAVVEIGFDLLHGNDMRAVRQDAGDIQTGREVLRKPDALCQLWQQFAEANHGLLDRCHFPSGASANERPLHSAASDRQCLWRMRPALLSAWW